MLVVSSSVSYSQTLNLQLSYTEEQADESDSDESDDSVLDFFAEDAFIDSETGRVLK